MSNIAVALKKCNGKCKLTHGYVGLKIIKFATEMGYKKCKVCECYFLYHGNIIFCQCCHMKLRSKTPRRNMETKIKALKFKKDIRIS